MKKKSGGIYIENRLLNSEAFKQLKPISIKVLLIFLQKRKRAEVKIGSGKRKIWQTVNNGELVFTYAEAERYGISRGTFSRAIGQLSGVGFIDIIVVGTGISGASSLYAESSRWERYGMTDFVQFRRIKRISHHFPSGKSHPKVK